MAVRNWGVEFVAKNLFLANKDFLQNPNLELKNLQAVDKLDKLLTHPMSQWRSMQPSLLAEAFKS